MSKRRRGAEEETAPAPASAAATDHVTVNVGGTLFETTKPTLCARSAYFQVNFSSRWSESNQIFLDRDPAPFERLLSFMRSGDIDLPESNAALCRRILLEAEFLGITALLVAVKAQAHCNCHPCLDRDEQNKDEERAAEFDQDHGGLNGALRKGVLPARYFGPVPTSRVVQIAPCDVDVWFLREGALADVGAPARYFQRRALCYALVEAPDGTRALDAIVARSPDEPKVSGEKCLASRMGELGYGCGEWQFRPRPQLVPLPKDFHCKYWKDEGDHSKGTFESRDIHLLEVTPSDPAACADPRHSYCVEPLEVRASGTSFIDEEPDPDRPPFLVRARGYSNWAGVEADLLGDSD